MAQLQSRYLTTLRGAGRDYGQWQTFGGGEVTAEAVLDRYAGQKYPSASGGEKTLGEVTLTRSVYINRDTDQLVAELRELVGVENAMVANKRPLDANGAPFGQGDTYTAVLLEVTPPETDTNSEGDKAILSLKIQPSNLQP